MACVHQITFGMMRYGFPRNGLKIDNFMPACTRTHYCCNFSTFHLPFKNFKSTPAVVLFLAGSRMYQSISSEAFGMSASHVYYSSLV
jgi:hypothetical protein